MLLSSLSAMCEVDLKKVIALSTLRQLGFMMFSLSLGMKDLAFFHLVLHALFKSLIFLCAGAYIHFFNGAQDSRAILNLNKFSNLTSVYFLYSNLSLMGLFFLSGFYSKDSIIERFSVDFVRGLVLILVYLRVAITAFYTIRLLKTCTLIRSKSFMLYRGKIEDYIIFTPIRFLFNFSLIGGSLITWVYFPFSFNFIFFYNKLLVRFILMFSLLRFTFVYNNLIPNKVLEGLAKI